MRLQLRCRPARIEWSGGDVSLKMGAVLAHRIAKPLGLNADRLLDAEREWFRC